MAQPSIQKKDKSVLLIFFGFMGAKPRHMEKYRSMFEEIKTPLTIHTIFPLKTYRDFFKRKRFKDLAEDTLNYTAKFIENEKSLKSIPIVIFYVFSNAGSMLIATINDILCDKEIYKNMLNNNEIYINGIIYESCPGLIKPTLSITHMNAFIYAMMPRYIHNCPKIIKYTLLSLNCIMSFWFYLLYKCGLFRIGLVNNFFNKLLCKRNQKLLLIPSLFLYSKSDKSVYYKHVDLFIKMKQNAIKQYLINNQYNQNDISQTLDKYIHIHCFQKSKHVQHFLSNPIQYKMIVLSFIYFVVKR